MMKEVRYEKMECGIGAIVVRNSHRRFGGAFQRRSRAVRGDCADGHHVIGNEIIFLDGGENADFT